MSCEPLIIVTGRGAERESGTDTRPPTRFYWLVPSTEWPAHKLGKLAFSLSHGVPRKPLLGLNDGLMAPDRMFGGLNVEKGYGAVASVLNSALGKKRQIINRRCCWFSVVDCDGPTTFARTIAAAAKANVEIDLYDRGSP